MEQHTDATEYTGFDRFDFAIVVFIALFAGFLILAVAMGWVNDEIAPHLQQSQSVTVESIE